MRLIPLLFALALFSCKKPAAPASPGGGATAIEAPSPAARFPNLKRPKNIVLLIGDGMGLAHLTAAMYSNGNHLELERFPVTGAQKTHPKDNLITDSAASATAMACGAKTANGFIGCLPNKQPLTSILELAERGGLATGLVATSSITHATPAAFIAHVPDRGEMDGIALDFLKTDIDLFIGGGRRYFADRRDGQDLTQKLAEKGFNLADYRQSDIKKAEPDAAKPFGFFTADGEPGAVDKGRDYLAPAIRLSLDFLKKRSAKGFFIMAEGSQIDWAAHDHDLPRVIAEVLDFDKTAAEALSWAEADGQTLVVVTADHETGGLSINQQSKMGGPFKVSWSTSGHTGVMVPVFAAGPGAELFGGIYDNTAIFEKMRWLLGL